MTEARPDHAHAICMWHFSQATFEEREGGRHDAPGVGMNLSELYLMTCNRLPKRVEDDESGARSALIYGADKGRHAFSELSGILGILLGAR